MKKMSNISTNSVISGKLFSLGTIEFSNVSLNSSHIRHQTMMAFVALAHTLKAGQLISRVHDAGNATEQL